MRLREIPAELYAREVLPRTAALWAGRRDFDTYVAQTLEIAGSGYGRRHYRTIGLYEGNTLLASFKRYERILRYAGGRLRGIGFGAVFTPDEFRGRGYASVMLANALDGARADGFDLGFLYSDIRPQFYEALGFFELSSRLLSLRADSLPAQRLALARLETADWSGVRRCFDAGERTRPWGFTRTPLVWEWLRTRMRHGSEHPIGQGTNLVVRGGRGIVAYVFGVRAPERDAYLFDEFSFADDAAAATIPALLRAAAGDLRRIIGWLPPSGARELLPRGSVRKRRDAIFMAAPLSPAGSRLVRAMQEPSDADPGWASDHV